MKLKKRFGQHFLRDKGVVRKIVEAAEIKPTDKIVEIGGGSGALTEEILRNSPLQLTVLEIDPQWWKYLSEKFTDARILNEDAVTFDFSSLKEKHKFLGNLPYNVSTAILRNILRHRGIFERGIFMVQKEVADRLTATAGKNYGYLPALFQLFFEFKKLFNVSPTSFYPPPKVWSTVFLMKPKNFLMDEEELLEYERFLKKAFSQRRKKLKSNLKIRELGELGDKRAEELPPQELFTLFRNLKLKGYSF